MMILITPASASTGRASGTQPYRQFASATPAD